MPTFKGVLAFDPSDAISLGMIPKLEPINIDDEPRGYYTVTEGSVNYEPYPGRIFPVAVFSYTSHPLDLENAEVDSNTNVRSKRFNFVIDFIWYKREFFEAGSFRVNISIIAVGSEQDKKQNTDTLFYVNANNSESISVSLRPSFPNVSEAEAAEVLNYVGDVGLSPSSRRLLPANVLRIYARISGSVFGNEINYSGVTFDQIFANVDITSDPAFFASGVTFLPLLKTGFQIANAETFFNNQFTISQEDIDNAGVFNDCLGIPVNIGAGVGKVICVTRDEVQIPEYQKRRVGYGVTNPWEGYWTGGIDGQYIVSARPLHYALQFESAVDDKFMGALNAPSIRYGGSTDNDIFYNCPRFSYTRIKNNFLVVFIPKNEAVAGFSFYVSAHSASNLSFYTMRVDNMMLINNTGIVMGDGDFVFTPQNYYVKYDFLIRNWYKKRTIDSSLLGSDPLADIPAFSSGVVSEHSVPLKFSDIVISNRPQGGTPSVPVSLFNGFRLSKERIQAQLPRLQRFPLGYFAAADFFATDFDGNNKIDGGIAYIDKDGNVDILLPKSQIRDKQWFNSYFGGITINPIVEQEYYLNTGNDGGFVYLFFDVSPICNSLYHDNEKIPYDHRFAKALSQVTSFVAANSESGVGICQLNFLLKRSTGSWTPKEDSIVKDPPPLEDEILNRHYYDLSNAVFDISSPMPRSLRAEVGQVSVSQRTGNGSIPASINAVLEWSVVSPVDLKANGRIYYERTNPLSGFTGQNSELNVPYVSTTPTSGKISTCIDFHGVNGALISAGSFGGSELRTSHIDGKLESQKRKLLADDMSLPSRDARMDWYDRTRPCWYGFAIDQLPIESRGSFVIRDANPSGSAITDPPIDLVVKTQKSKILNRSISYYQYVNGKWQSLQRQEKYFNINLPDSDLIYRISLQIKGKIRDEVPSYASFINMSFSNGSSSSPVNTDAILYKDVSSNSYSANSDAIIATECNVKYYGGKVVVFGGILDYLDVAEMQAEIVTVNNSDLSNYKISALDASIAMTSDGRYVAAVSSLKAGATTVDMFVKEVDRDTWRRIPNVVQPFSGEVFNSISIRSDKHSNKLYLTYVVNECLFIKPISVEWLDEASDQGVVSVPSKFMLPDKTSYGLSGKVYNEIYGIGDVRISYRQNRIRINPSFLVYGVNEPFLQLEKKSYENATRNILSIDSGDRISSRMEVGSEFFSTDNNVKKLYTHSPSESYSFEVFPDGTLFMVSVSNGGILMRKSQDGGRYWQSAFSAFRGGVSCRPIKFLKSDKGSSIVEEEVSLKYVNGSCPQVESVSTAIDVYGQKMAFAYTIRGMVFLQEIPVHMLMNDCIQYIKKLFTTDQREEVSEKDIIYPVFIGGSIPSEYVDSLMKKECDFAWRMAGPLSRENVAAVGNISMGSKAPAMIYLPNGTLRMHFEGDRGEIRAISVNASTVRGDYLP